MSKTINVTVKDKIASVQKDAMYICGNSDFVVSFLFDSEWDEFDTKTARFVYDGKYIDVVFTGNSCIFPVISGTYKIKIGVYAGELHTTTSAIIHAKKSILCDGGYPADPVPDVYAQIIKLLEENNYDIEYLRTYFADLHYVTQAEYDALSKEEQESGTYFITDIVRDIDTSLTMAGVAADALAVGSRFETVETGLDSARKTAGSAEGIAKSAKETAEVASSAAADALSKSVEAGNKSENALNNSLNAISSAGDAIEKSNEADANAKTALEAASNATTKSDEALNTANAAATKSNEANERANAAYQKAEAAEETANGLEYAVTNHLADIDALIGGTGVSEIDEMI